MLKDGHRFQGIQGIFVLSFSNSVLLLNDIVDNV